MIGKPAGLRLKRLLPFFLILGLVFGLVGRARAAVTLISFTATGMDGYILIEWETATELDNAGFYIQASSQENGTYSRINTDLIFSTGDGLTGASYSYQDNNVSPGTVRWYKLESVALNNTSEFSDPVSAVPNAAPGDATSTSTATPTLTPTATNDQPDPTSTFTPTATLTPTATDNSAYPGPPTPTSPYPGIPTTIAPYPGVPTTAVPAATATTGSFFSSTATPANRAETATLNPQVQEFSVPENSIQGTLVPFPSITIQFPDGTTGTPALNAEAGSQAGQGNGSDSSPGWSRYSALGFILLIWALLGGWFWLSFRKLE